MVLFIDSSDFKRLVIGLIDSKTAKVWRKKSILTGRHDSHRILVHLSKFLSGHRRFKELQFAALSRIYVVSGPGSFAGIRAGIAIALGIGFVTGVPLFAITKDKIPKDLSDILKVKARRVDSSFEPDYGAEPSITKDNFKLVKS